MENSSIGCGACRDLLPLCADGVASDESNALVEAHVTDCEACRAELTQLRAALPIPEKSPQKAMRTVKQKLRARRILIGVGSALGGAAVLTGAIMFLMNYVVPVKTLPDFEFSVADGEFTVASSVDSLYTALRVNPCKAQDGSDIFVVTLSMGNPPSRKLWGALYRMFYPDRHWPSLYPEPWSKFHYFLNPPPWASEIEPPALPEPMKAPDFNPEGKGLWRVYFIQKRDYQKGRIVVDDATGKLTEESMQYATLVWEETVG